MMVWYQWTVPRALSSPEPTHDHSNADYGALEGFADLIVYFHVCHLSRQVAFDALKKEYRDWVARGRSDALLAAKAEHM